MNNEKIIFRPTIKSDMEIVLKMERDDENRPYIRRWTSEQHINAVNDNNYAHLIIETIEDKRIVGYIILVGLENPDESIEFKRLVINEKGFGFGRKAMQMMKKFAFDDLRAHRLWLEVIEDNERALRLYKSEGFILEGTHREAFKYKEKFYSLKVMSLLAEEYRFSL